MEFSPITSSPFTHTPISKSFSLSNLLSLKSPLPTTSSPSSSSSSTSSTPFPNLNETPSVSEKRPKRFNLSSINTTPTLVRSTSTSSLPPSPTSHQIHFTTSTLTPIASPSAISPAPVPSFLSPILSASSTTHSTSSPIQSLHHHQQLLQQASQAPSQTQSQTLHIQLIYVTASCSSPSPSSSSSSSLDSSSLLDISHLQLQLSSDTQSYRFSYSPSNGLWTSTSSPYFPVPQKPISSSTSSSLQPPLTPRTTPLTTDSPIKTDVPESASSSSPYVTKVSLNLILTSTVHSSIEVNQQVQFPCYTHIFAHSFLFPFPTSSSTSSSNTSISYQVYFQVTLTPSSSLSFNDFQFTTFLGRGRFGKVIQVQFKKNLKWYAMKVLKKPLLSNPSQSSSHGRGMVTEKIILLVLKHPFIVSLKYAFQTSEYLCLVMPFMHGGELFKHLSDAGRFNESRVRFYAAELTSALHCLHTHDIIYRDLKPENILLDASGHIALCDFGLCKLNMSDTTRTHTMCGTPEYLACEVLLGVGYTKAVDWWTLGILIYEMLTGRPPFYDKNPSLMYQKILGAPVLFPPFVSSPAQHLILGLLARQPKHRFQYSHIEQHPFFESISWSLLLQKKLTPPFQPKLKAPMDTSYFDPMFTQLNPDVCSPTSSSSSSFLSDSNSKTMSNVFEFFDYAPPPSANPTVPSLEEV